MAWAVGFATILACTLLISVFVWTIGDGWSPTMDKCREDDEGPLGLKRLAEALGENNDEPSPEPAAEAPSKKAESADVSDWITRRGERSCEAGNL